MNIKKIEAIIEAHKYDFNDYESLSDFINDYGYKIKDIDDLNELEYDIHEYADGLVPIYYNDIIDEWKENRGNCGGLAQEEGLIEGEGDVYKIMQADLYAYYYNNLHQDFNDLLELLEEEAED